MVVFSARSSVAMATVLGLWGLWLASVPRLVSNSAFAVVAVLLVSGGWVSFVSWRNAQADGSVGQLLHETESAGSPRLAGLDTDRK